MNKKRTKTGLKFLPFLITIFSFLFCTGCPNFLEKPVQLAEAGGTVIIEFSSPARTLLPSQFDLNKLYFILSFTPAGGGDKIVKDLDGSSSSSLSVQLYAGNWDLDIKGYASVKDSADASNALVYFIDTIRVNEKGVTTINVKLTANKDKLSQDGSGTLQYSIGLPIGATGTLYISTVPSGSEGEKPVQTVNLTSEDSSGEITLDSGFYYVLFTIVYNGNTKVWRELAHIYDNAITKAVKTFNADDFNISPGEIGSFELSMPDYQYVYPFSPSEINITIFVPEDTDLNALSADISFSGAMIVPAPGATQNFNTPVKYAVYTENGDSTVYTITVTDIVDRIEILEGYLGFYPANTASNPYKVKAAMNLDSAWTSLVTALADNSKFVELDLSRCTGMTTFNPGSAAGKDRIVKIVLPDNSTAIGSQAFYSCTALTSVIMGNSVTSIGAQAFTFTGLSSIIIPDSVTSIGDGAFGVTELSSVFIPAGVTSIGDQAFGLNLKLQSITVDNNNTKYCSVDGILYDKDKTVLLCFPLASLTTELAIPAGVRSIENSAFLSCTGLTGVIIPDSITSIGDGSFINCTGLISVIIPDSITSIGDSVFNGCTSLSSISIPDSVTSIGSFAFNGCTSLAGISIPADVSNIDNYAFSGCVSLASVTFEGEISSAGFPNPNTFPGNLRAVYLAAGGGPGTYITENPGANPVWEKISSISPIGIEMVWVEGGTFEMGSNNSLDSGASPPHTVTLTSGFYMAKYQLTQDQWRMVMEANLNDIDPNPSYFYSNPAGGEVQGRRSVEQVSWYDALVFCNKLSMADGLSPAYRIPFYASTDPDVWGIVPTSTDVNWDAVEIEDGSTGYRLPTEAQWEYAVKGGNGTPGNYIYSGSDDPDEVAWYNNNSDSMTHEVGLKKANALGLHDLSGNVFEWCWDREGVYTSEAQTDPTGAVSGTNRMIRGGSWRYDTVYLRSVYRVDYNHVSRVNDNGFRLVRPF